MKVVPISYKSTKENLYAILDKVNAIYVHGDSEAYNTDELYQVSISYIISYMYTKANNADHFPVFLMGNSLQTYLDNRL